MKTLSIIPEFENRVAIADYAEQNDLCFEYNDFVIPSVLDDRQRVHELIRGYRSLQRNCRNDTMHGAFFDVTVFSYDKEIAKISEQRMRQSLQIAEEMGIRGVVFHGNYLPFLKRDSYDTHWLQKTGESVHRLSKEFPDIEIFMENMFDDSPEMLRRLALLLKRDRNVGLCYDYAHAMLCGGRPESFIKELSPFIRHIHINDHYFTGDDHLVPGDGQTNWMEYHNLISQYAPDASVLCEVRGFEAAKRSVDFLRRHKFYPLG